MSQLFEDGKVINVDGVGLECVGVSYQETEGERHTFGYNFRVKSELDAEREAAAKLAEEQRLAAEEAERLQGERSLPEVPEAPTQPEPIKEETLDVK